MDHRPPAGELAERGARVRDFLAEAGLDACLVLAPETQLWLSGLESFISGVLPQALVLPQNEAEEPALVVWDADIPLARATSALADVRAYRFGVDDPAAAFAAVVREKHPARTGRLRRSLARGAAHARGALGAAIAPAQLVDCSALLAGARIVKSPVELDCLRRAGRHADAGLRAALEHARPGVTERRLAAEIEYAMRRSGSATRRSRPS